MGCYQNQDLRAPSQRKLLYLAHWNPCEKGDGLTVWHPRVVRGTIHSCKKWRNALWLNAMHSGKKVMTSRIRTPAPPAYLFFLILIMLLFARSATIRTNEITDIIIKPFYKFRRLRNSHQLKKIDFGGKLKQWYAAKNFDLELSRQSCGQQSIELRRISLKQYPPTVMKYW